MRYEIEDFKSVCERVTNLRINILIASVSPYKDIPMKNNNAPVQGVSLLLEQEYPTSGHGNVTITLPFQ